MHMYVCMHCHCHCHCHCYRAKSARRTSGGLLAVVHRAHMSRQVRARRRKVTHMLHAHVCVYDLALILRNESMCARPHFDCIYTNPAIVWTTHRPVSPRGGGHRTHVRPPPRHVATVGGPNRAIGRPSTTRVMTCSCS